MTSPALPAPARPADAAQELLRLALLARLALQLGDQPLARRAARYAAPLVRLLAGLDDGRPNDQPLPEVDELLEQVRPAPTALDDLIPQPPEDTPCL